MAEAAFRASREGPAAVGQLVAASAWASSTIRGNDRLAKALHGLMADAGLPPGRLGDHELNMVVGAWLRPKLAAFYDDASPDFRRLPVAAGATIVKYVRAWTAYARRSGWVVTASHDAPSRLARSVNRMNGMLGAHFHDARRAASAPKQPGLRAEDVAAMKAAARSPSDAVTLDLIVLSRCLLLRPGEIVHFTPAWVDPCPRATAAGSPFFFAHVPRLKTVASTPFPRPALLYGPAIAASHRLSASMRRVRAESVADLLVGRSADNKPRAMQRFTAAIRELADRAHVSAERANAYAMRHGGAEDLIDRPAWVAEIQGGWARGSAALARHYQTGQLEILATALADPVPRGGETRGLSSRLARRDLLRTGQD